MELKSTIYDGDNIQSLDSFLSIERHLVDIIAETAIWVSPQKVLLKPIYPNVRRGAPKDKGKLIDGVRIDDNTYANFAIKNAISKYIEFKNYHVCHIWPGTTYDERYHTILPNLVLIPRIFANLSDFLPLVIDVLKYRSWELYGWHPLEHKIPSKPEYYPQKWRAFIECDTDDHASVQKVSSITIMPKEENNNNLESIEIEKVRKRVPRWLIRSNQINSRILNLYMLLSKNGSELITHDFLKENFEARYEDRFDSNYSQMKNFGPKNHAKVFTETKNGYIHLWIPIADFIKKLYLYNM